MSALSGFRHTAAGGFTLHERLDDSGRFREELYSYRTLQISDEAGTPSPCCQASCIRQQEASLFMNGVMIQGTSRDSGKSFISTGLCRFLMRRGLRVCAVRLHAYGSRRLHSS